jgi:hypothetical protein
MPDEMEELTDFLLEAKRRTYAGLDDDATVRLPLLKGSKQLEHQAGPYAYRDIYFGTSDSGHSNAGWWASPYMRCLQARAQHKSSSFGPRHPSGFW